MEIQERTRRNIYDQENKHIGKKILVPIKRHGITRGALGDINTNAEIQRAVGKVVGVAAEFEKKTNVTKGLSKSNYSNVQSKVDTGLVPKSVQPSSRPPLRREESTGGLSVRAAARNLVKDALNKPTNVRKPTANGVLQAKKEIKKIIKLPVVKETVKEKKNVLKEPTESLGKLKLAENTEPKHVINNEVTSPKLPANIEDIDEGNNSPFLMAIYIKDIYKYLTYLEEKYPVVPDYMSKQACITGKMRATLIDWLVEVNNQFSMTLETFQLTVGIIDRYLQVVGIKRNQLQLVGVTAMFIASKYEEVYPPDVADFIFVTDNAYTKEELFKCERDVMTKLGFCLARPIPLSFLRRFIKASHGTARDHNLAKYFIDLSLVEYSMSHYRPSELAAAALCLSLYVLSSKTLKDVWTPTMVYYSEYDLEHLFPIIKKMASLVKNVENSRHTAVFNKYSEASYAKVSTLPQLKGEAICELVESS